jgi:hypothetical protein
MRASVLLLLALLVVSHGRLQPAAGRHILQNPSPAAGIWMADFSALPPEIHCAVDNTSICSSGFVVKERKLDIAANVTLDNTPSPLTGTHELSSAQVQEIFNVFDDQVSSIVCAYVALADSCTMRAIRFHRVPTLLKGGRA